MKEIKPPENQETLKCGKIFLKFAFQELFNKKKTGNLRQSIPSKVKNIAKYEDQMRKF